MNCPTCTCSMVLAGKANVWWCEVCGTLATHRRTMRPQLVDGIRRLARTVELVELPDDTIHDAEPADDAEPTE